MPGPEAKLERKCTDRAKADGWFTFKLEKASINGIHDRFFLKDGRWVLIEFKAPDGKLSRQQEIRHCELFDHGAEGYVVRTEDEFRAALRSK